MHVFSTVQYLTRVLCFHRFLLSLLARVSLVARTIHTAAATASTSSRQAKTEATVAMFVHVSDVPAVSEIN